MVDAAAFERERCARITLNLARALEQWAPDPNEKFNTPMAICRLHGQLARLAAAEMQRATPKRKA